MLMSYCRSCKKRASCEYTNDVWNHCKHKNEIARNLLTPLKNSRLTSIFCDVCHKTIERKNIRYIDDTGDWVCYDCYPKNQIFRNDAHIN